MSLSDSGTVPAKADCRQRHRAGYSNTVFVDAVFGSKHGEVENFDKPFRTVRQGLKAASKLAKKRGGVIQVQIRPGTYREGRIKLQASLSIVGSGRLSTVIFGYYDTSALQSGEEATVLEHDVTNFEAPAVLASGQGSVSFRRMRLTSLQRDVSLPMQEAVKQTGGTHIFTDCQIQIFSVGGQNTAVFRHSGGSQEVERVSPENVHYYPARLPAPSVGPYATQYRVVRQEDIPDGLSGLIRGAEAGKPANLRLRIDGQKVELQIKPGKTLALDWVGDGYYVRNVGKPTLVWARLQTIYDASRGARLALRGNNSVLQNDWPAQLSSNTHLSGPASAAGSMAENFSLQTPNSDTLTGPNAIVSGAGIFVFLVAETVRSIRFNFQPDGGARFFLAVQFTVPTVPEGGIDIFGNLLISINGGAPVSGAHLTEPGRFAIDNSEDQNLFNLRTIALSEVGTAFVRAEADVGQPIVGSYTVLPRDANGTLLFAGGNLITLPAIVPPRQTPGPGQVETGFQVKLKLLDNSEGPLAFVSRQQLIKSGETVLASAVFDPASGQNSWLILRQQPGTEAGGAQVSQPVVNGADKLDWMIDAVGVHGKIHVDAVTQHGTEKARLRRIPPGTERRYTIQKVGTEGEHAILGTVLHTLTPEASVSGQTTIIGDYTLQPGDSTLFFAGGNVVTLPAIPVGPVGPGPSFGGGSTFQIIVDVDATAPITFVTVAGQTINNNQPIGAGQSCSIVARTSLPRGPGSWTVYDVPSN